MWIVLRQCQATPLLVAVVYLTAAVAPCPPAVDSQRSRSAAPIVSPIARTLVAGDRAHDEGHGQHVRADMVVAGREELRATSHHRGHGPDHAPGATPSHDDVAANEAAFTAPCPCGCDTRAGGVGVAKRLGPIVLPCTDPMPASGPAQAQSWLIQQLPDTPSTLPDAVPIAT